MKTLFTSLTIALALSACATTTSGERCEAFSKAEFAAVERDFVAAWKRKVPSQADEVERAIEAAGVRCVGKPFPSGLGVVTLGVTVSPSEIVIATKFPSGERLPLRTGAYIHELVHLALWNLEDDPDVNHGESGGPWADFHNAIIIETRAAP